MEELRLVERESDDESDAGESVENDRQPRPGKLGYAQAAGAGVGGVCWCAGGRERRAGVAGFFVHRASVEIVH